MDYLGGKAPKVGVLGDTGAIAEGEKFVIYIPRPNPLPIVFGSIFARSVFSRVRSK